MHNGKLAQKFRAQTHGFRKNTFQTIVDKILMA